VHEAGVNFFGRNRREWVSGKKKEGDDSLPKLIAQSK